LLTFLKTLCGSLQWQHLAALTGIEQHCSIAPQKDVCNNAFHSVNARGKNVQLVSIDAGASLSWHLLG